MFNTCTIEDLVPRVKAYQSKQKINTGYAVKAAEAVYASYKAGELPPGTNHAIQLALQFDGKETATDLVKRLKEKVTPYAPGYSLDGPMDCMDFVRNICLALFDLNPGDWTEGAYKQNIKKQVPWSERREMDLLLNKLSSRNPHATHAMLCIGNGLMLHTRSKSKPLMVTSDALYSAGSRSGTGCFRILSDQQYNSLIIGGVAPQEGEKDIMWEHGNKGNGVAFWQGICKDLGFGNLLGKFGPNGDGVDDDFGDNTQDATEAVQLKLGLPQTGKADNVTVAKAVQAARANDASKADLDKALARIAAATKALTA